MMRYHIYDPVPPSILGAHREGREEPLSHVRLTFGERREVFAFTTRLSERAADYPLAVLDLSCVRGLGEASRFIPLREFASKRPLAVVVRAALLAKFKEVFEGAPFVTIVVSSNESDLSETPDGSKTGPFEFDVLIDDIRFSADDGTFSSLVEEAGFHIGASYRSLYERSREEWLTRLVRDSLRKPPDGKRYHLLGDGTRANYWLDVKQVVGQTEIGFEIAYHLARELSCDFTQDVGGTTLVVGNNTAAVLATHIRFVFGSAVAVAVFDRVGPFPYLAKSRIELFPPIGANAVIIEDVLSTGREVDLIALLALVSGREINSVLALYHLDVAEPLLVNRKFVKALCRPAIPLNYIRLPMVSPEVASDQSVPGA